MAKPRLMTLEEFKQNRPKDEPVMLRKQFVLEEVKEAPEEGDLTLRFTISTDAVDRDKDTIAVDGWELANYLKNPVVLWAHDYTMPPVAKAISVGVTGRRLRSTAQFTPKDLYPFGYMVYEMYKQGFLHAVSVGFLPLEYEVAEDRADGTTFFLPMDFLRQELLEYSAVPVPANPEALIEARGKGIDTTPLLDWAVEVLDKHAEHLVGVPRQKLEGLYKVLSDDKLISLPSASVDSDVVAAKGVVPRDVSRELAPEDTPWEAPDLEDFTDQSWEELSDTEKRRIAGHFAWAAEMPPERYTNLKLPHHRPSDGAVVWRGVRAAAARLPQTDVPSEDVPAIQRHLGSHYRQFGRTPPWEEEDSVKRALWDEYVELCTALKGQLPPKATEAIERRRAELEQQLFSDAEPSKQPTALPCTWVASQRSATASSGDVSVAVRSVPAEDSYSAFAKRLEEIEKRIEAVEKRLESSAAMRVEVRQQATGDIDVKELVKLVGEEVRRQLSSRR